MNARKSLLILLAIFHFTLLASANDYIEAFGTLFRVAVTPQGQVRLLLSDVTITSDNNRQQKRHFDFFLATTPTTATFDDHHKLLSISDPELRIPEALKSEILSMNLLVMNERDFPQRRPISVVGNSIRVNRNTGFTDTIKVNTQHEYGLFSALDLDGDGIVSPSTDGTILVATQLGFSLSTIGTTRSPFSPTTLSNDQIVNYVHMLEARGLLDVDGDGIADPFSDSALITSYLTKSGAESRLMSPRATRTVPQIRTYIRRLIK